MKTQYYTATSLDGFIATEDDSLDWLFPLGDVDETGYPAFIERGRRAGHGLDHLRVDAAPRRQARQPAPGAWPYAQPTWVFSSRALRPVAGADIRFVRGDVRPVHAEMARPPAAGTSGSWAAATGRASSTTPACSTRSSSRSARSPWAAASRCCRAASRAPRAAADGVRRVGTGFAELRYDVPAR